MKYTKESTNKELLEVPITVTAGPSRRVHRNRGNVKYIGSMRIGLHAHDVPHGLRLAGILTGYRQGGTYGECLLSLFSWHNQTLNSWTMILGWLVSSWLLLWTLSRLEPRGVDLTPFLALWLCPTIHLPFTVGYHQFLSISPTVLRYWRALDVAFIFIASIPLTYGLAYFVMPLPCALCLTAITVGLSLHAWHNAASLPAGAEINKKANTSYVGYVVFVYTLPILLQAFMDFQQKGLEASIDGNVAEYDWSYTVWCAATISFCFLFGGVTYVTSFPDVFAPKVFDFVGSSQQLMHLSIAAAHTVEWLFVIHMFQRTRASSDGVRAVDLLHPQRVQ